MGEYVSWKDMIFKNLQSLKPAVKVVNSATLLTQKDEKNGFSETLIERIPQALGVGMVLGAVPGLFILAIPFMAKKASNLYSWLNRKQIQNEKERLYQTAISRQNAINKKLKDDVDDLTWRVEDLACINEKLLKVISELRHDLGLVGTT